MGSVRGLVLIYAVGACKFTPPPNVGPGSDAGDGGGIVDGPPDAPDAPDAPALCATWNPKLFDPCAIGSPVPEPTLAVNGSPYTYDTTSGGGILTDKNGTQIFTSPVAITQSDGSDAAIMNVESFTLGTGITIQVIGTKPLIIASWSTLDVAGTIDAGTYTTETDAAKRIESTTRQGAGGNPASCQAASGHLGTNIATGGGSGGGGGGAHHGNGGTGAIGNGDSGITGGPGGTGFTTPPTVIRGGCSAGPSGTAGAGTISPATSASFSNSGSGGGAVQLAARLSITIGNTGVLHAGGGGGAGAPQGSACGGGGGGSGGYIGLDAITVMVSGTLAANGGGGGGGAPFAGFGNQGSNAHPDATVAAGGAHASGTGCGLPGAAGGAGGSPNGAMATGSDSCGGGGGGGAVGFVLVWGALTKSGATISPPEIPNPN